MMGAPQKPPSVRLTDGQWVLIAHPRIRMPINRLAILRDVDGGVAEHPEWVWNGTEWVIQWPALQAAISERRLQTLMGRRMLITMSQRRARPGRGSQAYEGGYQLASTWRELLASAPTAFAVCGGIAVNYYARPRHTDDLDLVILSADWGIWDSYLQSQGWKRKGPLSIGGWTYSDGTMDLDLLALDADWVASAIRDAQASFHDDLPIIPLSWLVWMKLDAGRTGDQTDISHMIGPLAETDFAVLLEMLTPWLSIEDREDLEALYELGKWETESD